MFCNENVIKSTVRFGCTYHQWAWGHTCTCSCHCPCPWCWSLLRELLDCSVGRRSHCGFSGTVWNTSQRKKRRVRIWKHIGRRKGGVERAIKTARRHNMPQKLCPERYLFFGCDWVHGHHLKQHEKGGENIEKGGRGERPYERHTDGTGESETWREKSVYCKECQGAVFQSAGP